MNIDLKEITITPTEDYEGLIPMFIQQGLEFDAEEEVPTDVVQCWKAEDGQGRLVGGAALSLRQGEYICDGIATTPEARGAGLGSVLLDRLTVEVKSRGGHSIYLVARAPEFFRKQGFVTIERADAPNFFECYYCSQYQKTCFPEVMRLNMKSEEEVL
jgi:N-acetylglutamate synthase-like GNAT family acetyltransferase